MRLIFMGTPVFARIALDALHGAGYDIAAVYTPPPRRAGRGKKARISAVQARARQLGLPVHTPIDFADDETLRRLRDLRADIAVVAAYGLLLPGAVLDAPRLGCVNIHASLLPRWRGAAPIARAIMAGDRQSGISIMQMDEGLDSGPVLARAPLALSTDETAASLHDKLAHCGAGLIIDSLARFDRLVPIPQDDSNACYAHKITKAEAQIDWHKPAALVDAHIRALSPFPGAWFAYGGQRIKVLQSQCENAAGAAGRVLDDSLCIACGDGAVRLVQVQRAGRAVLDAKDFLRGFSLSAGVQL